VLSVLGSADSSSTNRGTRSNTRLTERRQRSGQLRCRSDDRSRGKHSCGHFPVRLGKRNDRVAHSGRSSSVAKKASAEPPTLRRRVIVRCHRNSRVWPYRNGRSCGERSLGVRFSSPTGVSAWRLVLNPPGERCSHRAHQTSGQGATIRCIRVSGWRRSILGFRAKSGVSAAGATRSVGPRAPVT
jgi:hypothetical protein